MSRPEPGEFVLFYDERDEEWRPILDGHYAVSSYGRVRRLKAYHGVPAGRLLRPQARRNGYVGYSLWVNNVGRRYDIHRFVARAFLGEPEGWRKLDVNHKDGNKHNPAVSNLEWATRSENQLHSYRVGLHSGTRGEVAGRARFTNQQIIELRAAFAAGQTRKQLAERYGVGAPAIDKIVKRQRWTHI